MNASERKCFRREEMTNRSSKSMYNRWVNVRKKARMNRHPLVHPVPVLSVSHPVPVHLFMPVNEMRMSAWEGNAAGGGVSLESIPKARNAKEKAERKGGWGNACHVSMR